MAHSMIQENTHTSHLFHQETYSLCFGLGLHINKKQQWLGAFPDNQQINSVKPLKAVFFSQKEHTITLTSRNDLQHDIEHIRNVKKKRLGSQLLISVP